MLCRDFIHDSLYHPRYGYFSKRAVIFSHPSPVDFPALENTTDFMERVKSMYQDYDDFEEDEALQVWHTPTELFKVLSHIYYLPIYGSVAGRVRSGRGGRILILTHTSPPPLIPHPSSHTMEKRWHATYSRSTDVPPSPRASHW